MKWIESMGGPLVAMPDVGLHIWRGVLGSDKLGALSDYERACAVTSEIGIIQDGPGAVLVLGDEPHRTAWIPRDDGGLLVRWVYADSEQSVETAIGLPFKGAFEDSGLRFQVIGPYRLIDAADPGDSLTQGSIEMFLKPGTYRVLTHTIDSGPEVRLIVHSLVFDG